METRVIRWLAVLLVGSLVGVDGVRGEDAKPADRAASGRATAAEEGGAAAVKKITLAEFEKMREGDGAVVLDVRTPKEFAAGHVPGAVNVDWRSREFADRVAKLNKPGKVLVYCLGGVRSAAATKKMAEMGIKGLHDYSGGWAEYSKSGKPVEK